MPDPGDFFAGGGGTVVNPGAGGAPGFAPAATAQPRPAPMIPSMTVKGIKIEFPDVPTSQNLTKDQQQIRNAQEVSSLLDAYEQATVNDIQREAGRKPIDKAIMDEMGKNQSIVGSGWEAGKHTFDDYRYKLHAGSVRPDMLWLSARLRSLLQALTAKQTGFRSYKAIQGVEEHLPFAQDTNAQALDKIKWWKAQVNEINRQSAAEGEMNWAPVQMQFQPTPGHPETGWKPGTTKVMPGAASPLTGLPGDVDPTSVGPGASPYAPGGVKAPGGSGYSTGAPPGVKFVAKDSSDPKYTKYRDSTGKWWYRDPGDGGLHPMGGP